MSTKHITLDSTPQSDTDGIGIMLPQALPPGSGSSVIFDTTGEPLNASHTLYYFRMGQSFYVGAGSQVVTDLKLELGDPHASSETGTISVDLYYVTAGSLPRYGTLLENLGNIQESSLSGTPTLIDMPISNGVTLSDHTQYFITLTDQADPKYVTWYGTNDPNGATGTSNQSYYWNYQTYTDQSGGQGEPFAFGMQVTTDSTCYAAGTHILTDRGEVRVERLRTGDHVMAICRGGLAEIKWIGHRDVDLRRHPRPQNIDPVRISAGAFGDNVPHRDLLLSPDHALLVDGALIAVRYLINGATIRQETRERITYYHIELDTHDVVLAEGLPAETFLDVGNRGAFRKNGGAITLHPQFADPEAAQNIWAESACAPSLTDCVARAALHKTLLDRAMDRGHRTTNDPDLGLLAGGIFIRPEITSDSALFRLPPECQRAYIMSRSVVPAHLALPSQDGRRLGVGVTAMALDGAQVALTDPRLGTGWHAPENVLRWTDGVASVETGDARMLTLRLHPGLTYWAEPDPLPLLQAA